MKTIQELGLKAAWQARLNECGYVELTPIQQEVIPVVLAGRDVLGVAKTGSGKTLSYVMPMMMSLATRDRGRYREPQILVLVPTRELAAQVKLVVEQVMPDSMKSKECQAVYGGGSVSVQMQAIGDARVVIATPGRLLELIEKNAVSVGAVEVLVVDEADKMLHVGFKEEMDRILALLPKHRQNLLFSATLNEQVVAYQHGWLRDPVLVRIEEQESAIEQIEQIAYRAEESEKGPMLRALLQQRKGEQVLVFASSIARADGIVRKLVKHRIEAAAMHSKLSQGARMQVLDGFKAGRIRVLVATDLLSRGIDIEGLPCVVNYELPRSPKDYIHRIGRTGRADARGYAVSLVSECELPHFRVIQKKMGKRVPLNEWV